jgi:large subunit ribosomal protein L13
MIVIDATGHVAGRLATAVAKKLLQGETVIIVNAELAIVSGDRWTVLEHYEVKRYKGDVRSGPFFPRRADLILKRTVRGMLPYDHTCGRDAYHRLKCYVGVPKEFAEIKAEKVEAALRLKSNRFVTISEIAGHMGSKVK